MGIYLVLMALALVLLLMRQSSLYENLFLRYIILFVIIFILFIIYVFRSIYVGKDYFQYYNWFENYFTFSSVKESIGEPGYILLSAGARYLNNFYLISSFVFLCVLFSVFYIKKHVNRHINDFSLLSFFIILSLFNSMFNPLRQSIACSILWIGLPLLLYVGHNYIKDVFYCSIYIIIIVIAYQFHESAYFGAIFFILILLTKLKYNKRLILIVGLITSCLFFTPIMTNIFKSLRVEDPDYSMKYQLITLTSNMSRGTLFIRFIPLLIQFIFLYIFVSNYSYISDKRVKFILFGYLLYLFMFSAPGSEIARRLQMYTFIFPVIYSCDFIDGLCINGIHFNKISFNVKILFVLFWIVFYYVKLILNSGGIVPYIFE